MLGSGPASISTAATAAPDDDDSAWAAAFPALLDSPLNLVAEEISSLRYVYPLSELRPLPGGGLSVTVAPRTGDEHRRQFCSAVLVFALPVGYPDAALPTVAVASSRGLDAEAEASLLAAVRREAEALGPSPFLVGCLIQRAADHMTGNNHPCGSCSVCLERLFPRPEPVGAPLILAEFDGVMLPTCKHALHRECFAAWEAWLAADDVRADSFCCPVCRCPVSPAETELLREEEPGLFPP